MTPNNDPKKAAKPGKSVSGKALPEQRDRGRPSLWRPTGGVVSRVLVWVLSLFILLCIGFLVMAALVIRSADTTSDQPEAPATTAADQAQAVEDMLTPEDPVTTVPSAGLPFPPKTDEELNDIVMIDHPAEWFGTWQYASNPGKPDYGYTYLAGDPAGAGGVVYQSVVPNGVLDMDHAAQRARLDDIAASLAEDSRLIMTATEQHIPRCSASGLRYHDTTVRTTDAGRPHLKHWYLCTNDDGQQRTGAATVFVARNGTAHVAHVQMPTGPESDRLVNAIADEFDAPQ